MHKSRLGSLIIDCQTDDLQECASFWGAALGLEVITRNQPGDENYRGLAGDPSQPKLLLQRVAHESRVHIDIETDDIEAEVARLERLGATRIEQIRGFWVMQAPSGHRFCVVKPQRSGFADNAARWPE